MEIKNYLIGDIIVSYLINENKNVSMFLIPKTCQNEVKKPWEKENKANMLGVGNHAWEMGSIAHFLTTDDSVSLPGVTLKSTCVTSKLKLSNQTLKEEKNKREIITELVHENGYKIIHTITGYRGLRGLECKTAFVNETGKDVTLCNLTSFALDNLSPFYEDDDESDRYILHRYYGGWSSEGKQVSQSIEELSLENTWGGWLCPSEKFGSQGSYPVGRYFPSAVFEDKGTGVSWAAQLAINSTWQMELTRTADTLSFTGGIGDRDFSGWSKTVKNGEIFEAPKAYISAVVGDADEAMSNVLDMHKTIDECYVEEGLPIAFNEYCSTWGRPTQEKMLKYCDILKSYGVKYAVIDAGWCIAGCEQDSNGEWGVDKTIFPDMKEMCQKIRNMGMIPGIWFEFEVTTIGSRMYEKEYDFMHLKRDGQVIKNNNFRSYWDFRREDVKEYLYEKVIKFLKDNGFGYIKVDYNANIGNGVDGDDSPAENLRQHLDAVRDFFISMKKEIPDLVIENCSSGGHRLEPSMMEVSTVSSFSDAHEAVEAPYVAANLHRLMLPERSLIWVVLRADESKERTIYSLANAFLGRMCLSGDVDKMTDAQKTILKKACDFYGNLVDVIKNGDSKIYGNRSTSQRHPKGTQIVLRKTENEAMAVCHAFDDPGDTFEIELGGNYRIKDDFYADNIKIEGTKLIVGKMAKFTASAVLLEK